MVEHPLRAALTNATYEFLGQEHQELLHVARRRAPHAHGAALATTVLNLLQPELAQIAQGDGEAFFDGWLYRHGGQAPRTRRRRLSRLLPSSEDETMEREDLRWVGLAVLIALAGGALVLLARKRTDGPAPLEPRPQPFQTPRPQPVRFAVAAFSGKVRDAGASAATAGDLLTHAAFWWVGSADSWDGIARTAGLSPTDGIPETDDALLVLVYEEPATGAGTPSSRPEGATRLREAARSGGLRMLGTFAISDPARLSVAGFRR